MKIVVLVKQVPDTWSERRLQAPRTAPWIAMPPMRSSSEVDDYAMEEGLRLQEAHGAGARSCPGS
jgi:electron transfer flavoprotein beta subunit